VRAPARLGAVLLASSAAAIVLADRRRWRRLRPGVERLRDEIAAIGAAPGRRVTVPDASETLRGLAAAINGMLSELDRRAASERHRTADALHTLRAPLAVMRTELDVSLRDEDLAPAAREVLVSAREEVDAMTRAVDNLLVLTAMDEGRIELRVAPVALLDAVDAAARPFRRLAVARRLTLETGGEAVGADADAERLHQALTNLIDNAIKFTGPGGEVRVTAWRAEDEVGVTVTDTGPGIGPEERARVFERFYRGDGGGGSGLGLAICREIAAAHGGSMRLKSEPSHGSAFTLALPARARPIA
jgi:two-component system, OmpR family, sensor histidine kinase BaeS